jgi:cell division protein FtsL
MAAVGILILVSGIAVVFLRHSHRLLFIELQGLQAERDRLNTQWGKLLLQEATSGQHPRIESTARRELGMTMPEPKSIVVLRDSGGQE